MALKYDKIIRDIKVLRHPLKKPAVATLVVVPPLKQPTQHFPRIGSFTPNVSNVYATGS
jgi:hypothetical protein